MFTFPIQIWEYRFSFNLIKHVLSSKIMVLHDISIFIHLLYPTRGQDKGEAGETQTVQNLRRPHSQGCVGDGCLLLLSALRVSLTSPVVLGLIPCYTHNSLRVTIPALAPTI